MCSVVAVHGVFSLWAVSSGQGAWVQSHLCDFLPPGSLRGRGTTSHPPHRQYVPFSQCIVPLCRDYLCLCLYLLVRICVVWCERSGVVKRVATGCKSVVTGCRAVSVPPVVVIPPPPPPARVAPPALLPVHIVNVVGLRNGCEKTPSGWHFSRAVKNPGNSSEPLLITMSFTNEHTTITDLTQTTTPLRTKTQAGSDAKKPCDTTHTVQCVLTGARKRAKQPDATKSLCRLGAHRTRSVCS